MRAGMLKSLLVIAAVAGFFAGLIVLGQWALEQIRGRERYRIAFADIDCVPPPGMTRRDFLDEVQYQAQLPNQISLLDEGLSDKVAAAFAKHPWVEKVTGVEVAASGRIVVRLAYRTPVMSVPVDGGLRAVDAQGVLLPKQTPVHGLPVFQGNAARPQGPAGTRWGDAAVEAAAAALRKSP